MLGATIVRGIRLVKKRPTSLCGSSNFGRVYLSCNASMCRNCEWTKVKPTSWLYHWDGWCTLSKWDSSLPWLCASSTDTLAANGGQHKIASKKWTLNDLKYSSSSSKCIQSSHTQTFWNQRISPTPSSAVNVQFCTSNPVSTSMTSKSDQPASLTYRQIDIQRIRLTANQQVG